MSCLWGLGHPTQLLKAGFLHCCAEKIDFVWGFQQKLFTSAIFKRNKCIVFLWHCLIFLCVAISTEAEDEMIDILFLKADGPWRYLPHKFSSIGSSGRHLSNSSTCCLLHRSPFVIDDALGQCQDFGLLSSASLSSSELEIDMPDISLKNQNRLMWLNRPNSTKFLT